LCFTGLCSIDGIISDADGRPFPHGFIAHEINVTVAVLESTIIKCKDEGRIVEDEHGLHITNWAAYQSEYQRQKPYRQSSKPGKAIHKICPACGYKALTGETYCPECAKKSEETELIKDFRGGKYGHLVKGK